MKPYYYVYRYDNHIARVRHATLEAAVQEAERLAAKHPGATFEVLKCVAVSRIPKPAVTFYLDDE